MQNIEVEIFDHSKQTFLAYFSYIVVELTKRHLHGLPQGFEVADPNLSEAKGAG